MDDLPDTAGHFDGFGFSAGSGNDSFNLYHNNYTSTDEVMFSPVVESRHGSVNSLSSPLQLSGFPGVQRYEADLQPDATPHFNIGHPYRSTDMSRETSYASHQSSMSSGQQYHGDQQAQWYSNDIPLSGTSMRRTVSLQADAANQQLLSPPSHNRVYSNHLYTGHTNAYSPVNPEEFAIFFYNIKEEKKDIYKELRNKSGVYMLINNITKKIYIGSSLNLTKRMVSYYYYTNSDKLSKSVIIRAMKKHRLENFSLGILEFCKKDSKVCLNLEQK